MMRFLVFMTFIGVLMFGCSKDEQIVFKPSDSDTLVPTSYIDVTGKYSGQIARIQFDTTVPEGQIAFTVFPPERNLNIDIAEIEFAFVSLNTVDVGETKGARSFVQRIVSDDGRSFAYFKFDISSLDSTYRPVYVYTINYGSYVDSFNGRLAAYDDSVFHYFIQRTVDGISTDYFFEGNKQ